MSLVYIFNFEPQFQGQRLNSKSDLPMQAMLHAKYQVAAIHISWDIVEQIFCIEGHWVKVKGQICKITSLFCITRCHDDVTIKDHQIWSINSCWVMARTRSAQNIKFRKVTVPRSKVKDQMLKIQVHIVVLGVHIEFLNTNTGQIKPNLQMILTTYILNFWPQLKWQV